MARRLKLWSGPQSKVHALKPLEVETAFFTTLDMLARFPHFSRRKLFVKILCQFVAQMCHFYLTLRSPAISRIPYTTETLLSIWERLESQQFLQISDSERLSK